jgi:hypothetical protein
VILPSREILEEIVSACRGSHRSGAAEPYREWFDELLAAHTRLRLDDRERGSLGAIEVEGRSGLIRARAGRHPDAEDHFRRAQRLLEILPLGDEARALGESMLGAQRAYCYYRLGDDARARSLLERSFALDVLLDEQHGYHVLHMHRIQLVHNMIRIDARRGRWRTALSVAHAVLAYLEAPTRTELRALPSPWCLGWSGAFAHALPGNLVRAMHAQIAEELAQMVAEVAAAGTPPEEISATLASVGAPPFNGQVDEWIEFQRARFDTDHRDPLAALLPLLRRGAEPSAPLWVSAAKAALALLQNAFHGLAS